MVPYGVWSRMVPYGSVWFRMVPYGSVWFRMVPYSSVWFRMVPYWASASNLFNLFEESEEHPRYSNLLFSLCFFAVCVLTQTNKFNYPQ